MDNVYFLSGGLFVMILVVWRMLVGSTREQRQEQLIANKLAGTEFEREAARRARKFEAMQLRICPRPCPAAIALRAEKFLAADVPSLPLEGCDRTCLCTLEPLGDRRAEANRRLHDEHTVTFNSPKPESARRGRDRRRRRNRTPYVELN